MEDKVKDGEESAFAFSILGYSSGFALFAGLGLMSFGFSLWFSVRCPLGCRGTRHVSP